MRPALPSRRGLAEALTAFVIFFSAVQLASAQFFRNALPAPDILVVPSGVITTVILVFFVLPAVILLIVDRVIAWRVSATAVLWFRSWIMIGALVAVLRQLQIYWGPTAKIAATMQFSSLFILALLLGALIVFVTIRFYPVVASFFLYFGPAALLLTVMMPLERRDENAVYAGYRATEAARPSPERPPVFVLVFDEFSYEVLLDDDGEIDATRYPNFARLAEESLHLTNATSNQLYTWFILPEMIDALLPLSAEYEIRLYEQAQRIERIYASGCGVQFTCRGARYLTLTRERDVVLDMGFRAIYEALPTTIEKLSPGLLHGLIHKSGGVPPPADDAGHHMFSPELLSLFLSDISAEESWGRIHFLHSLLPHRPFVFDAQGGFESDEGRDFWELYRGQVSYVDLFIGELLRRLEEEGMKDEAIVIITADHGMRTAFPVDGGPIEVDSLVTRIPMFIRAPDLLPGASGIDYQHVDFPPSLYDLLGLHVERHSDGVDAATPISTGISVLAEDRPEREKLFVVYDYSNPGFWRYAFNVDSEAWELMDRIDSAGGDRTLP